MIIKNSYLHVSSRSANLCSIVLRFLQLSTVVDVDCFPLGKDVERRGHRTFTMAIACRFGAAKRKMHLGTYGRRVDIKDTRGHPLHRRKRAVYVGGINGR